MTLLLASRNQNKLRELRAALPAWDIALLDAPDEPVEDGATFLDNARIKARHGRLHAPADAWVAGEDSGIEVAALGGRPGVESARWAEDGVARLLAELEGESDRRARYVCELVVLDPSGVELRARGTSSRERSPRARRGDEGFGYDPIFVPRGESRTVAELGDAWKAEHSHRAQAARALARAARRALNVASVGCHGCGPGAARADGALVSDHGGRRRSTPRERCSRARPDDSAARHALAAATLELVAAAADLGADGRDVTRVEVELEEGAVFVVREGGRTIGATTGPKPTSGLVVYDLRTCVQAIETAEQPKKRRSTRKPKEDVRVRKLIRLAVLDRRSRSGRGASFFGPSGSEERAGVSYADGSAVVLEPGSPGFERLASIARSALRT